jgi:uncharacterized protein with HEPN domain
MAATRSPVVRLKHIRDEIVSLRTALAGADYQTFAGSYWMIRTTERAILVIAEAVKALPQNMLDRHPAVEWHAIKGMANILRHEYQRVEPQVLWRVVTDSLPRLAPVIETMIVEIEHPKR